MQTNRISSKTANKNVSKLDECGSEGLSIVIDEKQGSNYLTVDYNLLMRVLTASIKVNSPFFFGSPIISNPDSKISSNN